MKIRPISLAIIFFLTSIIWMPLFASAQMNESGVGDAATSTATTTATTTPEIATTTPQRASILPREGQLPPDVFESRPVENFSIFKIMPFFIQSAVRSGIPTETVALVLLLPFLATLAAFVRNIIGLPSLDMLVAITFSIALLATDLFVGTFLLTVITCSSILARILFRKVRIMQLPKIALSMFFVSLSVLAALLLVSYIELLPVDEISIVPILLLILLSERIVRLQFETNFADSLSIIATTLGIGVVGYFALLDPAVRTTVLIYPEWTLLLIPINIVMGRYFGLRLTEYVRFSSLKEEQQ